MVVLMRIGLISDIHANLPALQAVLTALGEVDKIVCVGDLVGYYAEPNEVCDLIRDLEAICIRGNHDAYVTGALIPNASRRADYRCDWTRAVISESNLSWLEKLPAEAKIHVDDVIVTIRHASPWDEETYLYPDAQATREVELASNEILVVGHTHRPMVMQAGAGLLVNPGAVGQPRDYNPDSSFAILYTETKCVVHARAKYDVSAYQEKLHRLAWSDETRRILSRSR